MYESPKSIVHHFSFLNYNSKRKISKLKVIKIGKQKYFKRYVVFTNCI